MTEHRDTVVVTDRDPGTAVGLIAVVVLVLVAMVAWWFFFGPGAGSQSSDGGAGEQPVPSVDIPAPSA